MARFVLVHGAFGGAWSWEPVIGPLEAAGHTVEALDLPGAGDDRTPVEDVTLESYAARVGAALSRRPEPSVLVGTSMGGAVVTQAAGNNPERVASLVFVSAFMPADGQSVLDLTHRPEAKGDLIQANLVVEGDPPVGTLSPEAAMAALYNCCTQEQAARAAARRRPEPVAPLATPVHIEDAVLASIPRLVRRNHAGPRRPARTPAPDDPGASLPDGRRAGRRPCAVLLRHRRARRRADRDGRAVGQLRDRVTVVQQFPRTARVVHNGPNRWLWT